MQKHSVSAQKPQYTSDSPKRLDGIIDEVTGAASSMGAPLSDQSFTARPRLRNNLLNLTHQLCSTLHLVDKWPHHLIVSMLSESTLYTNTLNQCAPDHKITACSTLRHTTLNYSLSYKLISCGKQIHPWHSLTLCSSSQIRIIVKIPHA